MRFSAERQAWPIRGTFRISRGAKTEAVVVVAEAGTELLLVGDLSYDHALMTRGVVPGIGVRSVLEQSTHHVLELAERLGGAAILPAHDSGTAARLEAAVDATEP